jgi:hypothetical protein
LAYGVGRDQAKAAAWLEQRNQIPRYTNGRCLPEY